ncbi:MAG: S-layer homology domain-containing protein [Betaproteobacteria bacterium]|nr:S-layer homology domain-containing protein [Betaproteobacteria bacterium]
MFRTRLVVATLSAAAFFAVAVDALASHPLSAKAPVPTAPSADARQETTGGRVERLTVRDERHGATLSYHSLRTASGERVALKWLAAGEAVPGATIRVEGRRTDGTLFVDSAATLAAPAADYSSAPPANTRRYTGTLEFLHADDFDRDRCEIQYVLAGEDGAHLRLDLAVVPDVLEKGMRLAVDGVPSADGLSVEPSTMVIQADGAPAADLAADVSGTTQVLVILIKYADTATEPYTQAQITSTVFSSASGVANYFRESSYGRHMLAGTVTPWFTASFARPTTCDYSRVSNEAMTLARNAGYVTANYQKFVYVFPSLPGCGWAGLGGGSSAWINQAASVLVIGHELGHTFGIGHASSLRCNVSGATHPIDGTCTRSEYGDGFSIMGNSRPGHLSAPHKVELGYVQPAQYRTHAGGTATYALSPYETPGGTTYALKIPASPRRTYWIEFRQPTGFDAFMGTGATEGALFHTSWPSDWSCDSCLLDMTPATATTFSDAALPVGATFADTLTGMSVTVQSKTATALSVSVTTPTRPTYADVPATHSAYSAIETLAWHGVAVECGTSPLRYCPDVPITRAETAAFIERAKRGPSYAFTATGTRFADVPITHWAAKYIEQLHIDGITSGCATSPLRYCPDGNLTRAQMAPLLLRGRYGSTFNPGTATGSVFVDLPTSHMFAAWIERLYSYQITLGCVASPRQYCPDGTVTRAQMALFLMRAFGLVPPAL